MFEKLFNDIFPVTKSETQKDRVIVYNFGGKTVVTKNDMERLEVGLRLAHAALAKRKKAMAIMENRLQQDQKLIQRMQLVLKNQDEMLDRQQQIILSQQEKLSHIDALTEKMNNMRQEQSHILQLTQSINPVNG